MQRDLKKVKIAANILLVVTFVFFLMVTFSSARVRIEDAKYGYKGDGHCADPKPTAYSYLRLELFILDYANRVFAVLGSLWVVLGIVWLLKGKPT